MATKVALTAEEFRENSQRSIALFNTEKLSTDSTHVLKSAYCNSVHFCRCNLHGACGGKGPSSCASWASRCVAICTGRVEAKRVCAYCYVAAAQLQSARGVWRQRTRRYMTCLSASVAICTGRVEAKKCYKPYKEENRVAICTGRVEAKTGKLMCRQSTSVAICTGRVEAKE